VGRYRVTIQEAAQRLGVKDGAIRKRIERGTIESDKDPENGRVYVYVEESPSPGPNGHDTGYDEGNDMTYPAGYDMLIHSQQEQIEFLRRELERKDAILLNMTEAMKSLEAPRNERNERNERVTAPEGRGNGDVPPEKEKRSW
jgi:hypothetical protein